MIKIDRRNYSVDLLRILSMFGIVVLHVINHGIFKGDKFYSEVSYWPISLLNSVSLCAVNCFALISGYISSCWTINFKKYMKLYCQVWFYSVGISLVFFLKGENITNAEWLTACCPMYREMYWYFSAYTVLVIGAPLLHSVLNFESKDKIRIFIWLVILSFSFLGAIPGLSGFSYRIFRDGYNGTWLVFLYIVGGFCAKYGFRELCFWGRYVKNKYSIYYLAWGIFSLCVLFGMLLPCFTNSLSKVFMGKNIILTSFSYVRGGVLLIQAILLLYIFARIKIQSDCLKKVIRFLSSVSFAVYLIHDHYFVRNVLIRKFVCFNSLPVGNLCFIILGSAFLIFLLCAFIEWVRKKIVNLGKSLIKI